MAEISKIQIGTETYNIKDVSLRNNSYCLAVTRKTVQGSAHTLSSSSTNVDLLPEIAFGVNFSANTPTVYWQTVTTDVLKDTATGDWVSTTTSTTENKSNISTIKGCLLFITTNIRYNITFSTAPTITPQIRSSIGWGYSAASANIRQWNSSSYTTDSATHSIAILREKTTAAQILYMHIPYLFRYMTTQDINVGDAQSWGDGSKWLRFTPKMGATSNFTATSTFTATPYISSFSLLWGPKL